MELKLISKSDNKILNEIIKIIEEEYGDGNFYILNSSLGFYANENSIFSSTATIPIFKKSCRFKITKNELTFTIANIFQTNKPNTKYKKYHPLWA